MTDIVKDKEYYRSYSRKIEAPIYQPKGVKPAVADLYDETKTKALLGEIERAPGLSEEERQFLRVAAQRHTVLKFNKIAEYYAQAGEELQGLMEQSALVIIDFDRAIEMGFVKMTKEIAAMRAAEYGD